MIVITYRQTPDSASQVFGPYMDWDTANEDRRKLQRSVPIRDQELSDVAVHVLTRLPSSVQ